MKKQIFELMNLMQNKKNWNKNDLFVIFSKIENKKLFQLLGIIKKFDSTKKYVIVCQKSTVAYIRAECFIDECHGICFTFHIENNNQLFQDILFYKCSEYILNNKIEIPFIEHIKYPIPYIMKHFRADKNTLSNAEITLNEFTPEQLDKLYYILKWAKSYNFCFLEFFSNENMMHNEFTLVIPILDNFYINFNLSHIDNDFNFFFLIKESIEKYLATKNLKGENYARV